MISEINILGVFVPPLLVFTLLSICVLAVLRKALAWSGAYRLFWHRPLVDAALLVIITACVTAYVPRYLS
jgi:TctA family transporter